MTDTPTPPSWAEVPRATVRWSLARVDGDTTDVAVGDRVTLQPTVGGIAVVDPLDINPVSVILESRTYELRGDGALVDDQGDMAAVLAVDDPRVATPGGRVVQWIARRERSNESVRFPAAAGETVELSRWVAATAPESTQRSWAEQLVDAAEDVAAGLAAAVGAGEDAVAAAGQAAASATSAAGSASAAASATAAASSSAADASEARTGAIASRDGAVAARVGAETARTEAEALVSDASLDTAVADYLTVNPPPAGPPNELAIGTVTTGEPGSAAAASITGTAPEQVLNLTIPAGATGAVSAWEYYAAGRPDIPGTLDAAALAWRNAAPSGSTFCSTDGPQGAWVWRKRGASWVCVEGDTGWRSVASILDNGWVAYGSGGLDLRRVGEQVAFRVTSLALDGVDAANTEALTLPTGFQTRASASSAYRLGSMRRWSGAGGEFVSAMYASRRAKVIMPSTGAGSRFEGEITWLTDDAWPTTITF